MSLTTIRTAAHVAVIDATQGYGVLVLPDPATDLADPMSGRSLQAVDFDVMMRLLLARSIEPDVGDNGDLMVEPVAGDREVVALVMESISSACDYEVFMAARAEVLTLALAAVA